MKIILSLYIIFLLFHSVSAQDKRYTQGAENGYVWITLKTSPNLFTDYKHQYLATMLDNQRYIIQNENKAKMPLGCRDDINKLSQSKMSEELDLDFMVDMIDEFYTVEENMIIPIIGAYCYCIKNLAGYDYKELEKYRQELLSFSKQELK